MEIFDNIFIKLFSALIGIAFIIYWYQVLPLSDIIRDIKNKIFKRSNNKSLDDLTIEANEKQVSGELKKKNLDNLF